MKTTISIMMAVAVLSMIAVSALGCNTFKGAGKDIQRGGEAIENAADDGPHIHRQPSTIVASAETGGSISPSGAIAVPYGAHRSYAIRAERGYRVDDVLVDGRSMGAESRYSFNNVTGAHTITALFVRNTQ